MKITFTSPLVDFNDAFSTKSNNSTASQMISQWFNILQLLLSPVTSLLEIVVLASVQRKIGKLLP